MNSMPCWGWVTGDKSAGCPGCQKDQPQPGVPPAQHCLTLHCTGGALSTGGSLGCLSTRRTSDSYSALESPVWPKLQKVSRTKPLRSSWGHLACSVWRKEGWGVPSSQPTTSSRGGGGGADPPLMASNRIWGDRMKLHWGKFRLDTRKRFFPDRVVGDWPSDPGKWPGHQACQGLSITWISLLAIQFNARQLDLMILMDPFILELFCDSSHFRR